MPKILYLVSEDWFFVSHFLPMAKAAQECGYQVLVATRVQEQWERLKSEGFDVISIEAQRGSSNPFSALREFIQMFKLVRAERPDIVHCISLRTIIIGGVAAKFAGSRNLVLAPTGLGHLWLDHTIPASFARSAVRLIIGKFLRGLNTRYIFENQEDPRELGLDSKDADLLLIGGSGVDVVPLTPEPPGPPIKVAVVSRMIESKGIRETIDVVTQARALGAPVELHLFGNPDPANRRSIPAETLLRWSLLPGIRWHGHVTDVMQIWKECHIAVLLSYREGLPRSLVEAAAAGRPILATDVPGCREIVQDGIDGFLVPLGNIDAAKNALIKLCQDASLRRHFGLAANARFQRFFSASSVSETVRSLYSSLNS